MSVRHSLLFFLVAAIAVACMPDPLEVKNVPELKPRIVVSSQFVPDQSLVVLLTKSFSALQNTDDENAAALISQVVINDAVVSIKGPASTTVLTNLGNGLYGGVFIPFLPGEWYELEVKSETLGEVTARTQVREQINFEDLEAKLAPTGFDDTLVQVKYKLIDPPGKNNYVINIQRLRSNDLFQNVINPQAFLKLVDDAAFDGKEITDSLRAFPRNFKAGDTVAVSLANVSDEYYRFLKLREDNRFNLVEFLGEPLNYPSNVEGGLGYFNLFVPSAQVFVLEE